MNAQPPARLGKASPKAICPVCDGGDLVTILSWPAVPVYQNVLVATEVDALACPRGDIVMVHCSGCGLVFNAAFDNRLTAYSSGYEPSQAHSPIFARYLDEVARNLVSRHALRGKTIVEIGCGEGDFLLRVCRMGASRGIGFDPSYAGDRSRLPSNVTILPEPYPPGRAYPPADLVCARHVIEHMERPATLLAEMRGAGVDSNELVVFVETPRLEWILDRSAFWDIFYEHCSYFTEPALKALFERAGFAVTAAGASFSSQYQWIEGRPGHRARPTLGSDGDAHGELIARFRTFARSCAVRRIEWQQRVGDLSRRGAFVVWGAGAKGVTFLNALTLGRDVVAAVVDVNPRKQGRYIPGTGHLIIAPADLPRYQVSSVLVMNSNYIDEIRAMTRSLAPDADVLAL
jgi:hypothetical protein